MPTSPAAPSPNLLYHGDNLEDVLWKAADKLRGSMDASEYKHVTLGLV
jgi:type I restriction enzyme M protein